MVHIIWSQAILKPIKHVMWLWENNIVTAKPGESKVPSRSRQGQTK